ncbi:hypothetical protein YYC_04281 [Plasmodium yoelii 17X]|uniref:YIR protein n=1 Tax=Plasmodium yoelii 17X TaxID=1323249 RepID=V7PF04_PLAYE|nr:hypothetical protein YYC_04281 [Plasmodium yoelii 17X]
MDYDLCKQFSELRKYYPDELGTSSEHDFHQNGNIKDYCPNGDAGNRCETEPDKIKAGCLWLFEQLFLENKKNTNTVQYIITWLSYKLNQKTYNEINNLNDFYNKCIKDNTHYINCKQGSQDCSTSLKDNTGYNNYKEIIDKRKKLLNINIENMSKFYDAFKPLCNMYTEFNANNTHNKKSLENASQFVKKYSELNDPNNTKDEDYFQVLSKLSNDYNNLKTYCDSNSVDCIDIPSLTQTKTEEIGVGDFELSSEVTSSSSSITNKLIPVLSIIVAIPIFLGIFYKYSLFGFRKRTPKQHLREKLKN